jgi:hypothetical protein
MHWERKVVSLVHGRERSCPFFDKKQVYYKKNLIENPFQVKIIFPCTFFISPFPIKLKKL